VSALDRPVYVVEKLDRGQWRRVESGLSRRDLKRPGVFRAFGRIHGHIRAVNRISAKVLAEHV
jgi:hypothetical protein